MSKRGANSMNPEIKKLSFDDDTAIIEFLEKNLAQVLVDTAEMKVELNKLQQQKKELMEHRFACLMPELLHPLPEDMDLMPRLNQVTAKAEELIAQLAKLNQACDQHCKEIKSVTAKQLYSRCDRDANSSGKDLEKLVEEGKRTLRKTLVKKAIKRKEMANKKRDYQAEHMAVVEKMESLSLIPENATDILEQMMTGNALDKVDDPAE